MGQQRYQFRQTINPPKYQHSSDNAFSRLHQFKEFVGMQFESDARNTSVSTDSFDNTQTLSDGTFVVPVFGIRRMSARQMLAAMHGTKSSPGPYPNADFVVVNDGKEGHILFCLPPLGGSSFGIPNGLRERSRHLMHPVVALVMALLVVALVFMAGLGPAIGGGLATAGRAVARAVAAASAGAAMQSG